MMRNEQQRETTGGTLTLMSLFQSGAVLQREKPLRVWGFYEGTDTVSVRFAGQEKQAMVNDGRWEAVLDPLPANRTSQVMTVTAGDQTVTSADLLVGDVWFCNGQSNIVFTVKEVKWKGFREIAQTDNVRYFDVPQIWNKAPADEFAPAPRWEKATEETVGHFSAYSYAFAYRLQQELDIPIGIVKSAVGGTVIEHWLPDICVEAAGATREIPPLYGVKPDTGTGMYNSMVHPARGLTIKGILWYQGESSVAMPSDYRALFREYVKYYRQMFRDETLPIVTVQLPRYEASRFPGWADFRLIQAELSRELGLCICCGIDCGDETDIHPHDKRVFGTRAAELALHEVYGKDAPGESACPKSVSVSGDTITIRFQNAESGLMLSGGDTVQELFGVTADGGQVTPTNVSIVDDTMKAVFGRPVIRVDYAMSPVPDVNLYTKSGLPVAPFSVSVGPKNGKSARC